MNSPIIRKVSIITIIDNINFGTYLQAYATVKIIEAIGYNVELINYCRPYVSPYQTAVHYLHSKSRSKLANIIYSIIYICLYPFMVWHVKSFLRGRVIITRKYHSLKELIEYQPEADIFITGSDQVWNTDYNGGVDPVFFLDFTRAPKIAYGASVGLNNISAEHKDQIYHLLTKYSAISVRESYGVEIIRHLGISNVVQVLDPTLVLNKSQWLSIIGKKRIPSEKYLLIYSVETGKEEIMIKVASKIARQRSLKIFVVSPSYKLKRNFPGVDKIYNFASVEMFLSLLSSAEYVIASSFHGTAFAINFNKQFLSISPNKYNSRVLSLLQLCHLECRYITDPISDPTNFKEINYDVVNKILNRERQKSMIFLTNALHKAVKEKIDN